MFTKDFNPRKRKTKNVKNRNRKCQFVARIEPMEGRCLLSTAPHYTVQDLGVSNISILPNGFPMSVSLSPTGNATGIAVNNSGQITGTSTPPPGAYAQNHAFFYSGGMMTDITPGAWTGAGVAINNLGQVAGVESPLNGYEQAFVTGPNGTGLTMIAGKGSNSGFAFSINSSGDVVGRASIPRLGTEGFLYKDGTFYDLNDLLAQPVQGLLPGDHVAQAYSISDSGQILAIGNGTERYLLTPVPQPVAPTITWSNPADITYGTPLSATQLNATASVPGTFTYSVPEGTVLHAGAAQTLTATFTPDDTADYTTVTAEASINVQKAWVSVTPQNGTKVYGAAVPNLGVSYGPLYENGVEIGPGFVNGDTAANLTTQPTVIVTDRRANPVTSASPIAPPNPPGVPDETTYYIVTAYGAYSPDYEFAYQIGQFRITPAPLTVTASNALVHYGFTIPPLTGTITGLVNGDTDVATYTTTATRGSWAGYYPIVPHLTDPNYNITFINGTLTIYWSVPPVG